MITIRDWLKEIRTQKGLTQAEVAGLAGITPHYYNYIENGKRCEPDKCDTEKAIAAALGFDWTRFYEDGEPGKEGDFNENNM